MTIAAIIVAAGRGTRAGGDVPKQWQTLAGVPVVAHALARFLAHPGIGRTVLVIHPADRVLAEALPGGPEIVHGGKDRAASVRAALEHLAHAPPEAVLIHDGARPFVSDALIGRMIAALGYGVAAAPALRMTDALWRSAGPVVAGVQDRTNLWRAQTPQAFGFAPILDAHRVHPGGAADDVEVARAAGLDVQVVEGEDVNVKLTLPGDLARAEGAMRTDMDVRCGNGFDVHGFCEGTHVTLCGIDVPHGQGLLGHSDADVGMHALTDAIYGALAAGDIGRHFPPSDPRWKGAESHVFLSHAAGLARARGLALTHADVTLVCEVPKIAPHADAMRDRLAAILGVARERISVKATTSERLGFTGRGEGIAAIATATLVGGRREPA